MDTARKERLIALFFLIFSTILFIASFMIKGKGIASIGPGFMPRLIGLSLMVLSIAALLIKRPAGSTGTGWQDNSAAKKGRPTPVKLALTLISLFAYILLLKPLGFPLMTFIYLTVQFSLFSEPLNLKKVLVNSMIAIISSAFITVVFYFALDLFLPMGTWL